MVDSRGHIAGLINELNAASRRLQKYSKAQRRAAQAAGPLAESLNKIAAYADALDWSGVYDDGETDLSRSINRVRGFARTMRHSWRGGVGAREEFNASHTELMAAPPRYVAASDDTLEAVRAEMNVARGKALEAAKLMPMDALALRVQRLAAIAQDDSARGADLSPVSNAWLAVPVLSAQLSRELGKQIRIETMGEDVFVERRLIPVLATCIEQLVRGAAQTGLELAARRGLSRKPAVGGIVIMTSCDQFGLSLTVSDDGNGECDESTLDFVRSCIASLGGGVETVSVPDWGTSVTLAIPSAVLGAWRLQIAPRAAIEPPPFPEAIAS